nr:unnamed protein product [Digitaria exilis]
MDAGEASELHAQLAAAVHALNHDANPSARLAANQWLLALQRSPQGWAVATALLAAPDPPPPADLLFFAAQMLRRKIQSPGPALPGAGLAPQLLDALLLAARRFSAAPAPRQLLTQICLALSALALRAEGGVDGLFARMPHLPAPAVLELLTVLPEESAQDQAGDTGVDAAARCRFTRELLAHAPAVIEFLHSQSEKVPADDDGVPLHERNRRILRCLLSWVRVGCFSEMPAAALATHPLLTFAFNSLQVSFSFDVAIEVMTELVSQHQELPEAFLSKMPYIREVLLLPALTNRSDKIIAGLACLMCEVGQAAPALVAEGGSQALALTDALLRCVAFTSDDWEIADSTLQFWCTLAHFILGIDTKTTKRNAAQEVFLPVFSSLLDALLFRAQIDTDEHGADGAPCLPDGLAQFRMNLEELLVDICLLLGAPAYINKLFSHGWDFSSQSVPWKEVEVRMYALSMVADTILQDESPFDFSIVMHYVNILSGRTPVELNGGLFLVYKSFGDVIGSYSKWLSSSQNNIKPLLLFCASGISTSVSSNACSLALRKLCEDASPFIHEPQNLEILFWISEGMDKGNLRLEDEEEIVTAITQEAIIASTSLLELSFQKAAICSTAMHRGAALAAMSYISCECYLFTFMYCFLEVVLAAVLESPECVPDGSPGVALIQILACCGEGLLSNVLYALLGISALSRVHKSATILQQLAAMCSFCERTTWKALLSWSSLCGWLQSTVKSLPSEYLKQGEAEMIIPLWLKVLEDAGSDYIHSRTGDNIVNHQVYMQGKGGRTLKRIIRDFAESHRNAPTPCPS